jgi:putative ABC transport system ATP-binding protein
MLSPNTTMTGADATADGTRNNRIHMATANIPPIIEVRDLGKQVVAGEAPLVLLDDIDFTISPGDAVAIVGPSGSGKTTLLGLIAGLDAPTRGKVNIDGIDLFALDEDARARVRGERIGFVFQSFQLLSNLTALENVMLPLELAGNNDARVVAAAVLERVGLDHRLEHYPRQLSGGEQQRVAIARAFAPAPKLLLADEPTGNLDRATGERIIELLFDLNREHGTTLLLVTHDEDLARRCDRRLELVAGRLRPGTPT